MFCVHLSIELRTLRQANVHLERNWLPIYITLLRAYKGDILNGFLAVELLQTRLRYLLSAPNAPITPMLNNTSVVGSGTA